MPRPGANNRKLDRAVRGYLNAHCAHMLPRYGGCAVGFGRKRKGRSELGLAIRVFVPRGAKGVQQAEAVPLEITIHDPDTQEEFCVPTDVVEAPRIVLRNGFNPNVMKSPAPGGVHIEGHVSGSGGTLGGYVWDLRGRCVAILTNAHVLGFPEDLTSMPIHQPGGGLKSQVLGMGLRNDGLAESARARTVDCAIGSVDDIANVTFSVEQIGKAMMVTGSPQPELRVMKYGAASQLTRGRVRDAHWYGYIDTVVNGAAIKVLYLDCFRITSPIVWGADGDSGALVFASSGGLASDTKRVLGLYFAGDDLDLKVGYACPIDAVCTALGITTLPHGALINALGRVTNDTAATEVVVEALWARLRAPGRAPALRRLINEHRATLADLLLRREDLLQLTANVLGPIVGGAMSFAAACRVTIDTTTITAVLALCDGLVAAAPSAAFAETCRAVAEWVQAQSGRTVGEVVGVPAGPDDRAERVRGQTPRPTTRLIRDYLSRNAKALLEEYKAIAVIAGPRNTVILEFDGPPPDGLKRLQIPREGAPPLEVVVVARTGRRPVRRR